MGPVSFIIAIMGCGEADAACQEVGRTESQYESMAACNAETEAAMIKHIDIPYPVVVAQCRPANGGSLRLMSDEVKLPQAEPRHQQQFAGLTPQ